MWGFAAVLPVISALTWLGTIIGLLSVWAAEGYPHLPSMDRHQNIAYISDTGAFGMKPLFIAGGTVTVVALDLGLIADRWLRHKGRLSHNTSVVQVWLSLGAIFFAIVGAVGLIILTIFDTYHHDHVHDTMLGVFLLGYIISAILLCAEYQRLGIHYRQHRSLRISFWLKLFFIFTEVIFAIIFVSCSSSDEQNVAAVFEWMVAFIYTFYAVSFVIDLYPSVRHSRHIPQGVRDELEKDNAANPPVIPAAGEQYPAGHTDLGRQNKKFYFF